MRPGYRHAFPLWVVLGLGLGLPGLAQSNISGQARITLTDLGYVCADNGHGVALSVDVTGLSGDGGLAGLNAFALSLSWNSGQLLAVHPDAALSTWQFTTTDLAQANTDRRMRIVGSRADTLAPNQNYPIARLIFANQPASMTLTFEPGNSSLASRLVAGFGPAAIAMTTPLPLVLTEQTVQCATTNDPNGDGVVNDADIALFVQMFKQGTGSLARDCNGDGLFNLGDVLCVFQVVYPLDRPGYSPRSALDIDASGGTGNLYTDGVMLALFAAGVRDPNTLTHNLINRNGAGRDNPATILTFLQAMSGLMDIDGNGQVSLYTDITILWLHMAGVTGQALVNGLIANGATRTTAASIQAYLASLSY